MNPRESFEQWPRCIAVYDREEFLFVTDESHIPAEAFGIGKKRIEMISLAESLSREKKAADAARAAAFEDVIAECQRKVKLNDMGSIGPSAQSSGQDWAYLNIKDWCIEKSKPATKHGADNEKGE